MGDQLVGGIGGALHFLVDLVAGDGDFVLGVRLPGDLVDVLLEEDLVVDETFDLCRGGRKNGVKFRGDGCRDGGAVVGPVVDDQLDRVGSLDVVVGGEGGAGTGAGEGTVGSRGLREKAPGVGEGELLVV